MSGIVFVKGRKIDQTQLREFWNSVDIEDYYNESEDTWKSPITGELFKTKAQLHGHMGAYLRTPQRKDPSEPTRRGYVRALRSGIEPTDEQRKAHRDYQREHRRANRPTFSM